MPNLEKLESDWYCFQALPKKEHIAAQLLNIEKNIEVLCPRISYYKRTRRGKVRFVEALFPGYLFVHSDLRETYRNIMSTQGIRNLVAYGELVPRIPSPFITDLRQRLNEEGIRVVPDPEVRVGQSVIIADGALKDFEAIVSGNLNGQQRVSILLDFLGQQLQVRMAPDRLILPEEKAQKNIWDS